MTQPSDILSDVQQVYQSIVEHSIAAIFLTNPDTGEIIFSNPAATRIFGYSSAEFLHLKRPDIFVHDEHLSLCMEERKQKGKYEGIVVARRKNGETFPCEISSVIYRDNDGKSKASSTLIDISERKKTEEELRKSNERYQLATRASFDAIWDVDFIKKTINWGEGFETLFGYKTGDREVDLPTWEEKIHPDDKNRVLTKIDQVMMDPALFFWKDEYRFIKADGNIAFVIDQGIILRDGNGRPYRMVGAMRDITDVKMKEQELFNKEIQKQKAISQAIIDTQERERSDIGKELHDNVNQMLTTTKLYLDMAATDNAKREEFIRKSSDNIASVINEIRKLSQSLMIPSLGDLGLLDSIADLVDSINIAGKVQLDFKADQAIEQELPDNLKLIIYRIVQEAVNNIIKHSDATHADINLSSENGKIRLRIKDDGIGFDYTSTKKGAGLKNIENRVYLFNGSLNIDTAPGKGCELQLSIPLLWKATT